MKLNNLGVKLETRIRTSQRLLSLQASLVMKYKRGSDLANLVKPLYGLLRTSDANNKLVKTKGMVKLSINLSSCMYTQAPLAPYQVRVALIM